MRLCRLLLNGVPQAGFYGDEYVVPVVAALELYHEHNPARLDMLPTDDLLDYLPPAGASHGPAMQLSRWLLKQAPESLKHVCLNSDDVNLLLPVPRPPKVFLLAGNYAEHIQEDGSRYENSEDTFPYVFMKPPSTALLDPCAALRIPEVSPHHIDWEIELACVIGVTARNVSGDEALTTVAGYTILNDISDRKFRPNPDRKTRDWDKFFDWMYGKWHDGFAPCGPCLVSADELVDPQSLELRLELNGELRQSASTSDQIFPLAAVISFLSSFVTLQPGDIISTGTPAGVGGARGTYLAPGDVLVAQIAGIGKLVTRVEK